ncbi:MAG: ADP-forming succinate--CoA ligase subunit beta [Candidatus Cloacimonetes bacterium]|nr:ADP-forming succinate--CoA ligase subunit beta [Candidatus Cloacimonadota bacterium]MBS3767275.1 ADP-forming succinate--CoA ligase subunit beta [Candidatus Cloacimonadota bacterium]
MKIDEYQAKEIFTQYNIPTPQEILCKTPQEVKQASRKIGKKVVVKAQVKVGGRGKAGGVKLANNPQEAEEVGKQILGMEIKGLKVQKVLVSEAVEIKSESYVGFTNDRSSKKIVCMASPAGGVDIEEVAKETPDKIYKILVDPLKGGLHDFQARNLAFKLYDDVKSVRQTVSILKALYKAYIGTDASLVEINPLVENGEGKLIALDAKFNFDDNALYRHPEIAKMREVLPAEKVEREAKEKGLSYIKLDGFIGCMVNGAGLAMAAMDMIKLFGGNPANFLDIGGSSNPKKVINAMKILLNDDNVQVVMINIFGGITRCDDVANGLMEAFDALKINLPVVIRLTGTNEKEGLEILKQNKELILANSMQDAAKKAIELANK